MPNAGASNGDNTGLITGHQAMPWIGKKQLYSSNPFAVH